MGVASSFKLGTHYLCPRAVFTGRGNWCHFWGWVEFAGL